MVHFENATGDIDLSSLTADIDPVARKSFFHMPSWPPEIEESKILFIPSTGVGTVYICPNATSLDEVTPDDPNKVVINVGETKNGMTVTTTYYNGEEYYMVFGVTDTGGGEVMEVIPDTTPPTIESVILDAYTTIPNATIHVTVNATDDVGVTSVTADSTALVETGSIWEGNITAPSATGDYTIIIRAEDAAGNSAETTVGYSVVTPKGGFGVGVIPTLSNAKAGDKVSLNVKIVSTENFDDVLHVYVTKEGIPPAYQANFTFNWTDKTIAIPSGGEVVIPIEVNIPGGVSGYKMFRVMAKSTRWRTEGFGTGILNIK